MTEIENNGSEPFNNGKLKKLKTAFKKGNPGGPGRPKGSRNKSDILLEQLGQNKIDRAYSKLYEMCENGDTNACKFIIERSCPPDKGTMVSLEGICTETVEDIEEASKKIAAMMLSKEISGEEASVVNKALNERLKMLFDTKELKAMQESVKKVNESMGKTE